MPASDIITLQNLQEKLSAWSQDGGNHLYAIVDMGSNGIRFSITSVAPPFTRLLKPVYSTRAAISLFDALTPSPSGLIFPDETITLVAEALAGFHRLALTHNVDPERIFVFATEAMRRADNAGQLLSAISDATQGLGVQILEPAVETLFGAVMGSRSGLVSVPQGALFLDLGGGSVQMTWVNTDEEEYELHAAATGSSMPYGAAKLIRILEEQAPDKQRVEINTLRSGMKTVYSVLCSQFPALNAIKSAHERGEGALLDVYMCGGGFRGYGSMLMHSDAINNYPIPDVNTYTADGAHFKQTARMLQLNSDSGSKIFSLSKRRRRQFPAIVHVVEAFLEAVPNIRQVTFCGGSNREGALMMMMPRQVRESNPLEILANVSESERPVFDATLQLLRNSLPQDLDLSQVPMVLSPGLGYLFLRELWTRHGFGADTNASFALRDAIIRDSDCPGLSHLARALFGVTVCVFRDGKLASTDQSLFTSLESILKRHHAQTSYWARYLGVIARVLVGIIPVMPKSAEELLHAIKFESTLVEKEKSTIISLSIGIAPDHVKGVNYDEVADSIKENTKSKEDGVPKKVHTQIYRRPN